MQKDTRLGIADTYCDEREYLSSFCSSNMLLLFKMIAYVAVFTIIHFEQVILSFLFPSVLNISFYKDNKLR